MEWIAFKDANTVPRGVALWVDYWGTVQFLPASIAEDELQEWLFQCGYYMVADVPVPAEKIDWFMQSRHADEMVKKMENIRNRLVDGNVLKNEMLQIAKVHIDDAITKLNEFIESEDRVMKTGKPESSA